MRATDSLTTMTPSAPKKRRNTQLIRWRWWLYEGKLGITTVVTNAVAILFVVFFNTAYHEDITRGIGAALQAFGIVGVMSGVLQTRAQFGLPPVGKAIKSWLARFPLLRLKPISGSASQGLAMGTSTATGVIVAGINPDASLEDKVAFLLRNVESLQSSHGQLAVTVQKNHRVVIKAIDEERAKQDAKRMELQTMLKSHATGGLNLTLCGAFFLLVGVVLGTLPYKWMHFPI